MIDEAWLAEVWVFDDPAQSAERFRDVLDHSVSLDPTDRLEVTTQLARALGLQGLFDEASRLLDSLDATDAGTGRVRLALERGRLRNSAGHPGEAVPFFVAAALEAADNRLGFLEVDALHMLAIADPVRAEEHARRGMQRAETATDLLTRRWSISLHNNLGWTFFDQGRLEEALIEFEQAAWWAANIGTDQQQIWAAEALDECRAALRSRQ